MESRKKSRKSLFVATALTIMALASVLVTASVLLGTINGMILISVLITASVLLGILYIRLLLSRSFRPSNYRSSNLESKEAFHSRLNVRDYSSKRINHSACPECGFDLGSSSNNKTLMPNIIGNNTEPKARDLRDKTETKVYKTYMQNEKVEAIKMDSPVFETHQERTSSKNNGEDLKKVTFESKEELENTTPILSKTQSTMSNTQSEKSRGFENANVQVENKCPKKENNENIEAKKDVPGGCNNYFGYLGSRPKGVAMPDECYACARLIDCCIKSTF